MISDSLRTSRVVGLALVVGVFFTAEEMLMHLAGGRSGLALGDIADGTIFWVVWALLTPFAVAAVRRWPLYERPLARPLIVNLVVALALATIHNLIAYGVPSVVQGKPVNGTAFVWGLFTGVLFYAVIVMIYTAARFRLTAATLERELTQTKLDTLRSQLRPHFLFNTLNAISVFVKEDADKAQEMILRLSTLLRRSLDEEAHEVSLENELAFVNDYLDIQRGRFGDRLAIDVSVDPAMLGANVPVFLLQPLLENAIEHGRSEGTSSVALSVRGHDDMLHITVTDDGPGVGPIGPLRERVGLRNTRERLRHLYGARATVHLSSTLPAGARVEILIPLHARAV